MFPGIDHNLLVRSRWVQTEETKHRNLDKETVSRVCSSLGGRNSPLFLFALERLQMGQPPKLPPTCFCSSAYDIHCSWRQSWLEGRREGSMLC